MKLLSFASAIPLLEQGFCLTRLTHRDSFIFRQVPSDIPAQVVPVMTSLPPSVREVFVRRNQGPCYRDQLAYVLPNGDVRGYSPSPEDVLANDWMIYDTNIVVFSYDGTMKVSGEALLKHIKRVQPGESLVAHVVGYTLTGDDDTDGDELVEASIEEGLFLEVESISPVESTSGIYTAEIVFKDTSAWVDVMEDKIKHQKEHG